MRARSSFACPSPACPTTPTKMAAPRAYACVLRCRFLTMASPELYGASPITLFCWRHTPWVPVPWRGGGGGGGTRPTVHGPRLRRWRHIRSDPTKSKIGAGAASLGRACSSSDGPKGVRSDEGAGGGDDGDANANAGGNGGGGDGGLPTQTHSGRSASFELGGGDTDGQPEVNGHGFH